MASTEAQKRAAIKYAKEHIKRIPFDVPLQKYDEIKAAAASAGETVNGYIKIAIDQRMESERQ